MSKRTMTLAAAICFATVFVAQTARAQNNNPPPLGAILDWLPHRSQAAVTAPPTNGTLSTSLRVSRAPTSRSPFAMTRHSLCSRTSRWWT